MWLDLSPKEIRDHVLCGRLRVIRRGRRRFVSWTNLLKLLEVRLAEIRKIQNASERASSRDAEAMGVEPGALFVLGQQETTLR
jgi:hypothetical protein